MICDSIAVELRPYLDRQLSGSREQEISRHLQVCAVCRGRIGSMRAVSEALRRLPPPEVTAGFTARLEESLDRIDRPAKTASWLPWRREYRPSGLRLAWALGLLALIVACGRFLGGKLIKALELNRSGRWEQAERESEAVLKSGDATIQQRCQALESAAYSQTRLDHVDKARELLERFERECTAVAGIEGPSGESKSLKQELTSGTPAWKLHEAFRLARSGDWPKASRMAHDAAVSEGVAPRDMCEALALRAQAESALDRPQGIREAVRLYERSCTGLPSGFWTQSEILRIKEALSPGTPAADLKRALSLYRAKDWKGALVSYGRVVASRTASEEQRCEAVISSGYADLKLGRNEEARGMLKRFQTECAALPPDHWLRGDYDGLKEGLERESGGGKGPPKQ